MAAPSYHEVVELKEFSPARVNDRPVSSDRFGPFSRTDAYEAWKRSLFPIEWFDSRPERSAADAVDDDSGVTCWVRLHVGELPILWNSGGQNNSPELLVIDADTTHWVVEVKMDKEMSSEDVKGKREAARRWANHVNADANVAVPWRYLLVSELDMDTARGSWAVLKKLGDDESGGSGHHGSVVSSRGPSRSKGLTEERARRDGERMASCHSPANTNPARPPGRAGRRNSTKRHTASRAVICAAGP
jgi:type III restriction enzyme